MPDEHAARLFPLLDRHLNMHGRYTFASTGLPTGALRPLRDSANPDPGATEVISVRDVGCGSGES